MNENKENNFENEEVVNQEELENQEVVTADEVVEDAIDEVIEENTQEVEDTTDVIEDEETQEESLDTENVQVEEVIETPVDDVSVDEPVVEAKKTSAGVIVAIVVIVALIVGVVTAIIIEKNKNPYNSMGYPIYPGYTIEDAAISEGISYEEFLTLYQLPADMPKDTPVFAANEYISTGVYAQMDGLTFELYKQLLQIPDETSVSEPKTFLDKIISVFKKEKPVKIDASTPWRTVMGELTLGVLVGEENVESVKEQFELDESVNASTKYKEIRDIVDKKTVEIRTEQLKELMESEKEQNQETQGDETQTEENQAEETQTDVAQPEETTQE